MPGHAAVTPVQDNKHDKYCTGRHSTCTNWGPRGTDVLSGDYHVEACLPTRSPLLVNNRSKACQTCQTLACLGEGATWAAPSCPLDPEQHTTTAPGTCTTLVPLAPAVKFAVRLQSCAITDTTFAQHNTCKAVTCLPRKGGQPDWYCTSIKVPCTSGSASNRCASGYFIPQHNLLTSD
jgi:hypothetical protein